MPPKVRIAERIVLLGQQACGLCHRVNAAIVGHEQQKQQSDGLKAMQDSNLIRLVEIWSRNLEKDGKFYPTLDNVSPALCEKVAHLLKGDAAQNLAGELEDLYTLFLDCFIVINCASEYFAEVSEPLGFFVVGAENGCMELSIEVAISVSWMTRLIALLSLFHDRVDIALVYAFTYQQCRGNAEAWFTDVAEFLQKLSKPISLLRDRLSNGRGIIFNILMSFHKSNGLLLKLFDVRETIRIPELDLMRDCTLLQYPLASRPSEDLMICCRLAPDLTVAFAFCALIALVELIEDDEAFAVVELMVKSRATLPLMEEHRFDFINEIYGSLADSADIGWKAFQENLGKEKRNLRKEGIKTSIAELCQHAVPSHLVFRHFLKESIDRANWLLQDCGGVAAPQLPCLLALVGLAKAEIGWSFHHSDFKPQSRIEKLFKEHKFSASKAFDPQHMTWLYKGVVTLKSNIEMLKTFITPYYVELARRYSEQFTMLRAHVPEDQLHTCMKISPDLSAYVKHDNIDLVGLKLDALRLVFLFSSDSAMEGVQLDRKIRLQLVDAVSGLYRSMDLAELVSCLFQIGNLSEFSYPPEHFTQIILEAMKVSSVIKSHDFNSSIGPLLTVPASWPVYSHEFLGPKHVQQVCSEAEESFCRFVQLSCDSVMACVRRIYDLRMVSCAHVSNIKAAHELGPSRFVLPKLSRQELIQVQSCILSMTKSIDCIPSFPCGHKQVCAVAFMANAIFAEVIRFVNKIVYPNGFGQRPCSPASCLVGITTMVGVIGDLRMSMRLEVWTILRNALCFKIIASDFGALGKPTPSPFPKSSSEHDIAVSYGNFLIKTITEKGSQVYWHPLSKCFSSKDGKHFFQDYTSGFALENLCSLIGPVGVRTISQLILQHAAELIALLDVKLKENLKPIDDLNKMLSNHVTFQMVSSALKTINAGETGAQLSTFGALLTLRSQLLLALNRVLTHRLNLIPTLVLDSLCCSRE
jgi:hypothetical protein